MTAASQAPTPAWVTAHKSWNLEHTTCRLYQMSFPSDLVELNLLTSSADGFCFFQAALAGLRFLLQAWVVNFWEEGA